MASKTKRPAWSNRIVGHDVVPADDLLANPLNWRVHPKNQQNVMEGILDEVGWLDEVKVSKHSGLVIDGHMRVSIAISKGEQVPICYLELTPEEEALALATYNPVAALAVPDESVLNEVLGQIETANPEVAVFLDGLYAEVNQQTLKTTREEEEGQAAPSDAPKTKPTIRVLMQVTEIEWMEQAITSTGEPTRGAALMKICKFFVEQHAGKRRMD